MIQNYFMGEVCLFYALTTICSALTFLVYLISFMEQYSMNTIQLEKIDFEPGKSFKLFSPRLRNTFLWHYHPELELVYVEADAGIRHVGTHISTYTQSDLVFIGSNLPHLNFDYRLRSDYHQIVIQLRCDFMGTALDLTPEFAGIEGLFKAAEYGIAFHGETKLAVAKKLRQLEGLSSLD